MRKLLITFVAAITTLFSMHSSSAQSLDGRLDSLRRGTSTVESGQIVYDARGKPAGHFVPYGPVVLDFGGTLIAVYPERDAEGGQYDTAALKWGTNGVPTFYAMQDCAGTPLINSTSGGPAGTRPAALIRDSSGNLTAYIAASGRSSTRGYRSWRDAQNGTCTNTWESSVPINTWELERTIIINQLHPEPLIVR
jgi:hypothetical protein